MPLTRGYSPSQSPAWLGWVMMASCKRSRVQLRLLCGVQAVNSSLLRFLVCYRSLAKIDRKIGRVLRLVPFHAVDQHFWHSFKAIIARWKPLLRSDLSN